MVDEQYRQQGIAQKLFEEAFRIARSKNMTHINLSVRPARVAAKGLYEKIGFQLQETNYYRYVFEE